MPTETIQCNCEDESGNHPLMHYKGEISVWQIWQCPACKEIELTNFP